ncbi:MAG: hypothetical protein ACOC1O_06080 [bacterium]
MSNNKKQRPLKRSVIKEELVELTGDHISALILNQFIYWSERVRDYDKMLREEKERLEKEAQDEYEFKNGWIYKTASDMNDEIMINKSDATIMRRIDKLIDKGWLKRRRNPKNKQDRTYQYRLDIIQLQKDLMVIGHSLDKYPLLIDEINNLHDEGSNPQNEDCNVQNENSNPKNEDCNVQNENSNPKNEGTVPEIIIDNTTETILENTSNNNNNIKFSNSEFKKIKSHYEELIGRKFTDRLNKRFYELSSNADDILTALERCHDYNTNSNGGPPNKYIYKVIKSIAAKDDKTKKSTDQNFSDWDDGYDDQLIELIKNTYNSNFEEEIDFLYLDKLAHKNYSDDEIVSAISRAADKYYEYIDSLVDFKNKKTPYEFILNELEDTTMV